MTDLYRRPVGTSSNPISGIEEVLFLQARIGQQALVSHVATLEHVGAIYTLETRLGRVTTPRSAIAAAVTGHRDTAGADAGILIDAGQYAGKRRIPATAPLDSSFVDFQLDELRLPWALTDPGFVHAGDSTGLHHVLAESEKLSRTRRVIAVLAIDSLWLRDHSTELRQAIETYGVRVALAVGHSGDPFSAAKTVAGLLHVLESAVPVSLIRSDLSSVGALAGGATFGSIGTSSGLRHVFPIKESGGAPTPGISVVVPQARTWVRRERLAVAIAESPDEMHWRCDCERCQGQRLDWLYDEHVPAHNLHAAAESVRSILGEAEGRRLEVWGNECENAQFKNMAIESLGTNWTVPKFLGAWRHVVAERSLR